MTAADGAPSGSRPDVLSVATLTRLHGVRGELKLRANPDVVALLRNLADDAATITLRIERTGDEYEVTFAHVRGHESAPIVAIDGVDTREAAEEFRGATIYLARELLPELADDEVWLGDLVGCAAVDSVDGAAIGTVTAADAFPANAVLTVRDERDGRSPRELLVPFIDDAVPEVDLDARRIVVDLAFLGVDEDGAE